MPHGSRLMAQGTRLKAHDQEKGDAPPPEVGILSRSFFLGPEPFALSPEACVLSHQPLRIINSKIQEQKFAWLSNIQTNRLSCHDFFHCLMTLTTKYVWAITTGSMTCSIWKFWLYLKANLLDHKVVWKLSAWLNHVFHLCVVTEVEEKYWTNLFQFPVRAVAIYSNTCVWLFSKT